jgi:hypothetical protein
VGCDRCLECGPEHLGEVRERVPAMAARKVDMEGFVYGTWTVDGHTLLLFADEGSARSYNDEMVRMGAIDGPGMRCVVYDVAEVAALARGSEAPVEYQGLPTVWLREA